MSLAKLEMQTLTLCGHASRRKAVLEYLQRRGVLELVSLETEEGLGTPDTGRQTQRFERAAAAAEQALAALDEIAPEKRGMLASLNGRREIGADALEQVGQNRRELLALCYDLTALQKQAADCRAEVTRIGTALSALEPWRALDVPMSFSGTRGTQAFLGVVPYQAEEEALVRRLREAEPELSGAAVEIVSASREQSCVFALCLRQESDRMRAALANAGFSPLSAPPSTTAREEIARLEDRQESLREAARRIDGMIAEQSSRREEIRLLADYYQLRRDKYEALGSLGVTEHAFFVRGYLPAPDAPALIRELSERFGVYAQAASPDPDADIPVAVRNNAFVRPAEGITEMYSMPSKRDVDPNPVMSFFYYFFFGMMLSDFGYGLLITIGTIILQKKFRLEKGMRRNLRLFEYCGLSTMFWGIMFGGYFGDAPSIIAGMMGKEFTIPPLLMNPINEPIQMLVLSVALGLIHIFVGMGVKLYQLWRSGKRLDAVFDVGFWMTAILGLILLLSGMMGLPGVLGTVGMWMAIVSAVGLVATQGRDKKGFFPRLFSGVASLYDITSYVSDLMSYSRLMALGLATGAIASVINLLAGMPGGALKIPVFILVFILGHALNLAINMLGAYVHTMRLQYVEFFSKFYEGGGRLFAPFSARTKYVRLREEAPAEK